MWYVQAMAIRGLTRNRPDDLQGRVTAHRLKQAGIHAVSWDSSGKEYHGKVKVLSENACKISRDAGEGVHRCCARWGHHAEGAVIRRDVHGFYWRDMILMGGGMLWRHSKYFLNAKLVARWHPAATGRLWPPSVVPGARHVKLV